MAVGTRSSSRKANYNENVVPVHGGSKRCDKSIDSVASPRLSSIDVVTSFSSDCKRQRLDCNSTKLEESSRFLEYWVSVQLSNVQQHKYCSTLLSNSRSLCSPSKTDPIGVLRSILVSNRHCCDHPCDVDQSLREVGIEASGKLKLLDEMLREIKKLGSKVLILFHYIGGSGRDLMGDILDDFLLQRFGIDSYERVDNGIIASKKRSALKRFNDEKERFVFLLETRACLPSIKLSAVGAVIIFGSNWSPVNDLRALQRITLDSRFEQIRVFRLYSSFTLEEKLLILAKQDKTIDSNVENISPCTSHMLLQWGASYLFSQLEIFHDSASTLSHQSHLQYVVQEFLTILHRTVRDDMSELSLILQAKQNQGLYRTEMPLFGEQKIQVMDEDEPHTFWTELLEGKHPRWKCSTYWRNRKRVRCFDELQERPQDESAQVAKRRKNFVLMPAKEISLAETKTAPSEVLEGGSVQREKGRTNPMENNQQDDGALCIIEMQNAPQAAETSTFNGAIVELTESLRQMRSSESTSNRSPPNLPSVSAVEHQSNNEDQTAHQSSQAPRQSVANHIELSNQDVLQASDTREAPVPSDSNDQQVGVLCIMNKESELPERMNPVFTNIDFLPYSSPEVAAVCRANNKMQNTSQTAETSTFNGAIDVTRNVSNPNANVVELKVVSAVEHRPNNGGHNSNQSCQAPREAPIPLVSNVLPLRTAPAVSSRMPLTLYHDPLQIEMERIMKEKEQTTKIHKEMKLQLKSECDKKIELAVAKIRRKYDAKINEKEAEFLVKQKELDVNYSKVVKNKMLADAFRSKCTDNRASGLPSAASAISMQTVFPAVVYAQTMASPLQVYNPWAFFSGTPTTRPPRIGIVSSSAGSHQIGTAIHDPASHLQLFRPLSSISVSGLPLHSDEFSGRQAHHNRPAASVSLWQPYVKPPIHTGRHQLQAANPVGTNMK
ncbi:hypothetical protein F3Y22_tig00111678pilonHSYRG00044 [Hibiscus syriacus]|uniref:Helicase C-terminal domain-containing protein n=1 Tax=Hibiscus syriacus TaxID=106335 RepID=A0A6A2Y3P2_HIBSY|nr:hypothetical protein F3Y22_tig00111678pilonHSYRG00044 [Hibiscus syriacus]